MCRAIQCVSLEGELWPPGASMKTRLCRFASVVFASFLAAACVDQNENFFANEPARAPGGGGAGAGEGGHPGTAGWEQWTDGGGSGGAGGGSPVDARAAAGSSFPVDASLPSRSKPSVDAGPDVEVSVGERVVLDGLSVADPDGDDVLVSWSVVARPSGSESEVHEPDSGAAEFVPDLAGAYTLHVTASDGASNATDTLRVSVCEAAVDAFPLPLSAASSIFVDLNDDSVEVVFSAGFVFSFFGVERRSLYLNTNGGITFGQANPDADLAAELITEPTIAPFWSDHDVRQTQGPEERPNQLRYQQCPDRFVVTYRQFQEIETTSTHDSAVVTLLSEGDVLFEYGEVRSGSILSGLFDGTHSADRRPNPGGPLASIESSYDGYATRGTGIVLTDHFGAGPSHAGELSSRSVLFRP